MPVPPPRGAKGTQPTPTQLASGYVEYIAILRALHERAAADADLQEEFEQVRDIELALFGPTDLADDPDAE